MHYLDILDGQGRRWRVELKRQRLLLGREQTCDIYLPHPNVSRRHAQLQRNPQGQWLLQDLNSLNKVYVDDKAVQQFALDLGSEFRIADFRLTLLEASTVLEPGRQPGGAEEPWTGLAPAWLDQLHAFQRSLLHLEEPRQVLERLADEFCRIGQPQTVAVATVGEKRYNWVVVAGPGARPDDSFLNDALRHASDESEIKAWTPQRSNGSTPGSVPPLSLLFPMKGRSGVIGQVFVHRPKHAPLPPEVQRYLSLLATGAGLIWDNLHIADLRAKTKQMAEAMGAARRVQTDLFPPTFDVHERLNAFAVNLPSVYVSGDYYDLLPTGPSSVAFVVADAMGHGMSAALLMAAVSAGLRMGLSLGQPWERIFQVLDKAVAQRRADVVYVTGLLGQIDLDKGELEVVSAGHPWPSVLVGGSPVSLPPSCRTRPWGLDYEAPWQVGRVALGEDWSVVCYTDGLTEGGAAALTSARIAAYHRHNHRQSAEDLCQGLLSEAAGRQADGSLLDDQTILVLRSPLGGAPKLRTVRTSLPAEGNP